MVEKSSPHLPIHLAASPFNETVVKAASIETCFFRANIGAKKNVIFTARQRLAEMKFELPRKTLALKNTSCKIWKLPPLKNAALTVFPFSIFPSFCFFLSSLPSPRGSRGGQANTDHRFAILRHFPHHRHEFFKVDLPSAGFEDRSQYVRIGPNYSELIDSRQLCIYIYIFRQIQIVYISCWISFSHVFLSP